MTEKSQKGIKLLFFLIIGIIATYMLYIMVSFYTSDKSATVNLSFKTNTDNIMTSANAEYALNPNGGALVLETNDITRNARPKGAIGEVFTITSTKNDKLNATLTVSYDDSKIAYDEENIILIETDENGNTKKIAFEADRNENTLTAKINKKGMWVLADKSKIN